MTIGDLLKKATGYLKEKNVEDPSLEAGLLLCRLLDKDQSYIYAHTDQTLNNELIDIYKSNIERRGRHEPFAYITGECGFLDSIFYVNPHVLIPREETELLAQGALWALGKTPAYFNPPIPRLPYKDVYHVLDVGTGSGCIAVSLAKGCDSVLVDALDLSIGALDIARKNAVRHNVKNRIRFINSDFLTDFAADRKYDLIVSNPPYIPERDIPFLPESVREYEPHTALVAGVDGLMFYRALADKASSLLFEKGMIIVECGFDQGHKVSEIFSDKNMDTVILKDLAGIDRIVSAIGVS